MLYPNWPFPPRVRAFTTLRQQSLPPLPGPIFYLKQVHGCEVVSPPHCEGIEADAMISSQPEKICVVRTADCVPLLLTNFEGTEVAAIHAGWRGLALGVIENTFAHLKTKASEMMVWIGPAISAPYFEVGSEVYETFMAKNRQFEPAFQKNERQRYQANLVKITQFILEDLCVGAIYLSGRCTFSDANLCSYRRDSGHAARLSSVIYIEKKA